MTDQPLSEFQRVLLDELLELQADGAHELPASADGRRRSSGRRRTLRAVSAVLLVPVMLAGAASAARTIWHPALGGEDRGSPSAATARTPAAQRRQFGVLARQQTDLDRSAETERALRLLSPGVMTEIHVRDIRVLLHDAHRGLTAILVPAGSYGAAWARLYHGRRGGDGLCLLFTIRQAGVSTHCYTSQEATQIRMPATTAHIAFGLVPDGVATVRITFEAGAQAVAKVSDNFFSTRTARGAGLITGIRWVGRNGGSIAALGSP